MAQIHAARKKNLLDAGNATPEGKGTAGQFARDADPASLLEREKETRGGRCACLRKDYPDLARGLKLEAARE